MPSGGRPLVLNVSQGYYINILRVRSSGVLSRHRPVAVDFPGFGRSGGELTVAEASVPRLSAWLRLCNVC